MVLVVVVFSSGTGIIASTGATTWDVPVACVVTGISSSLYLNLGCSGGLATLVVLTRPSPGVVFTLVVAATSGLVTGLALVGVGFVVVVLLTEGAR